MLGTADKYPEILHSMNIWHKAKLLKKVLNNVSLLLSTIYVHVLHIYILHMNYKCITIVAMYLLLLHGMVRLAN